MKKDSDEITEEMKDDVSQNGANDKPESEESHQASGQDQVGEMADMEEGYKNKYLMALADYQNLLKQTAKDKESIYKFANEGLLMELLPIFENLKMVAAHEGGQDSLAWLEGIRHLVKQLKDTFNDFGVEEIEAQGKDFDYTTMEAVGKEETGDKKNDHKVAKVLKTGYKLNGKVIMPAKVVVFEAK